MVAIDSPDRVQPERGGLLSVANVITDVPPGLINFGASYASMVCGKNKVIPAAGVDKVPDIAGTTTVSTFGIYRLIEGPMLITRDAPVEAARQAFLNAESYAVEKAVQGVLNNITTDITPTIGTPITNMRHAL